MLKGDILDDIGHRLGELVGQEDFWPASLRKRHVERAVQRFAHEDRWTWLLAVQSNVPLVAGNSEVELIDDVDANRHMVLTVRPNSANDDGSTVLPKRVSTMTGMKLRVQNVGRGVPAWYYVAHVLDNAYAPTTPPNPYGSALVAHVIPTPSETSTVEYAYFRNPLASTWNDADEFPIPDQYIDAVIAYATGTLWLNEMNGGGKAQEQFNIYNSILAQAKAEQGGMADDDILAWGAEEPQYGAMLEEQLLMKHLPATLG